MKLFIVSRKYMPKVWKTASYHGFNCYVFDHIIYEKRIIRGWVFKSAKSALEFMSKEGNKYKYDC